MSQVGARGTVVKAVGIVDGRILATGDNHVRSGARTEGGPTATIQLECVRERQTSKLISQGSEFSPCVRSPPR